MYLMVAICLLLASPLGGGARPAVAKARAPVWIGPGNRPRSRYRGLWLRHGTRAGWRPRRWNRSAVTPNSTSQLFVPRIIGLAYLAEWAPEMAGHLPALLLACITQKASVA
jgi:hypothetical protein